MVRVDVKRLLELFNYSLFKLLLFIRLHLLKESLLASVVSEDLKLSILFLLSDPVFVDE